MATTHTQTKAEGKTDDTERKTDKQEQARAEQGREGRAEQGRAAQQREGEEDRAQAERNADRATERLADAGRTLADTGAETMRRGTSLARDTMERTSQAQAEMMRNFSDQMGRMVDFSNPETQRTMERASENMRVVARYGTAVVERAQPLMQEIVNYTSQAAQAQLQAFGKLQRARTPFDLIATQGELMRTELELWIRSGRRIGEMMSQMGEQFEELLQDQEGKARSQSEDAQRQSGRGGRGNQSQGREQGRDQDDDRRKAS